MTDSYNFTKSGIHSFSTLAQFELPSMHYQGNSLLLADQGLRKVYGIRKI